MCVAVVGQFSMVLACGVQCLSVNTCVPCELCCFKSLARGVHQSDRHQHKTRDGWFFLFCFVFMGHVAFPQQGVFDLMLELFFFFFMWLCCVCVLSDWRKMWGSVMSEWCFSVKLGNLMTHVAKTSPSESLIRPLHFLPLFAWCKLSPKLNGCDFSFLQFIVACVIYWDHLFNLCLIYFMGWPDPQKGFSKI